MKCSEISELLSAYANDEITNNQKELVEKHLAGCSDCRAILEDYTEVRQQLTSLRKIPLVDIKEAIMFNIRKATVSRTPRGWLRPSLVAVPLTAIVAVLLSLYFSGSFFNPTTVLAKAYSATESLKSFRFIDDEYMQKQETSELDYAWHSEFDYAAPDRYHLLKRTLEGYSDNYSYEYEVIIIGNKVYGRGDNSVPSTKEQLAEAAPTKEKTLEALDILNNIERMPDEIIDGTAYYHYKGTVDMEKWLEKGRPDRERQFQGMIDRNPTLKLNLEDMLKAAEDMWRTKEITNEFWIGKDDYLVRRWKQVIQTLPGKPVLGGAYTSIATFNYYDFNGQIEIEPPVTTSDELLPGWRLESSQ